ncbi:hypothetical protein Hanom_Chr15g01376651 [Helianthus anomalus]
MMEAYIFNRSAGLSFGCCAIFEDKSFAISNSSSRLSGFFTRSQIMVKIHSRSKVRENKYRIKVLLVYKYKRKKTVQKNDKSFAVVCH